LPTNEELAILFVHEVLGKGNLDFIEKYFHSDFSRGISEIPEISKRSTSIKWMVSEPNQMRSGKEGFIEFIKSQITDEIDRGYYTLKTEIGEIFEKDNKISIYYRITYELSDPIMNLSPYVRDMGYFSKKSNKNIPIDGSHIIYFKDNMIIGLKFIWDTMSFYDGFGWIQTNKNHKVIIEQYFNDLKAKGIMRESINN